MIKIKITNDVKWYSLKQNMYASNWRKKITFLEIPIWSKNTTMNNEPPPEDGKMGFK